MARSRGFKMSIAVGGMFLIPVRLDKTTSDSKISLHEYHKDDMGSSGRKAYCKSCGKDLTSADIVKGIEVTKGQVVTFSKEELESLPLSTTKNIEVDGFVKAEEINRLALGTSYYLSPDETSSQAYNLFAHGLKKMGRVAVGKVALRNRENLCIVYPMSGGLVLSMMCWHDEFKDNPSIPKTEITDTQADLMDVIIKKYSKPFDHSVYSDQYNDALKKMAEQKLNGDIITISTPQEQQPQNIEDALRALAAA